MRYLILILLCYWSLSTCLAQVNTQQQQKFVIKRARVLDQEKIFSQEEIKELDSFIMEAWEKGIADIAIVTVDAQYTDSENFERHVSQSLSSLALGEHGKENGIVIAWSKNLRQIHIKNVYNNEKLLPSEIEKKITTEQFLPYFDKGEYFEGTKNSLNAIIRFIDEEYMKTPEISDASSIFTRSIFKNIRSFILENGSPQTFRDEESDNPSYSFTTLDVFLGPSEGNSFIRKDFDERNYFEMIIRDASGTSYPFVYFEDPKREELSLHEKIRPGKVYWFRKDEQLLSQDVWPLIMQIEDEIIQKTIVNTSKSLKDHTWVLKQEFDTMENFYQETAQQDTLSFQDNFFYINGKEAGIFELDPKKRTLSLRLDRDVRPAFAIYPIHGQYHYRYLYSKEHQKLYLVPLDEFEGDDMICIEGSTLLFETIKNNLL